MGGALDPAVASGRNLVRGALTHLAPGSRVVVGVSGGADSLALAAVTAFVANREAYDLRAVIVDHQLQDDSAMVARQAAERLKTLAVPAEIVTVEVGRRGGPEAAARAARYSVLEAEGADAVLLAHTLDDQAETVLLGLGRGSGPRSIAGMSVASGVFRRPFLALRRADTERICRSHGLEWWTDPHNRDPAYRRSRIRADLMPLFEEVLGGGVAEALARTADQVRADGAFLDSLVATIEDPRDIPTLSQLPAALRSRVLRRVALEAGADPSALTSQHLAELDRLVTDWHGQHRIELPGGVYVKRVGACLMWETTPVAG